MAGHATDASIIDVLNHGAEKVGDIETFSMRIRLFVLEMVYHMMPLWLFSGYRPFSVDVAIIWHPAPSTYEKDILHNAQMSTGGIVWPIWKDTVGIMHLVVRIYISFTLSNLFDTDLSLREGFGALWMLHELLMHH